MRDSPAQAPVPHRYAPVGVNAVLREPGSPGHWRVLACWGAAFVVSLAIGLLQHSMGWEGTPVQIGSTQGTLLLHPHMLAFGLIALWFGFSWGYAGVMLAGVILLVVNGASVPWAVLGAAAEGLGLLAITLCYRSVPIRVVPRTPFSMMSFILVALIASLTGSAGALFFRTGGALTFAEALSQLSGSWIGPFIQWVFIAGPLMLILGPKVQRFKQDYMLGERWSLPKRNVVAATVTVLGATMVLSVAGNRVAARARLNELLQSTKQPGWAPDAEWTVQVGSLLDGTNATSAFSMMLLVCVALVGYQVAVSWSRATERQAAALRESEGRNRAIVEAIPDLVLRIRADGTVLDHKDGLGLLGTGDVKGQSITDFWPSRITHPLLGRAEDALARGSSVVEFRMDTDQGLRDYEARLVAFGQKEVVAIVRDVTQQRSAVRDNQRTMVRVTRDLRAPLTSVRGALGLIRGGVAGEIGAKANQLIDVAYRNAERMVRLAEDILATEGPGSTSGKRLKLEQVDLARLVEASVYEIRKRADELGVEVEVTGTPTEARVKVDPDRVVEVVHVLLNNALKFSPSAGRVAVSVRRSRDIFRVEVRDEGHGIPEAFQGRVFRRGPNQGQGGLSMARDIVLTLGGRIGFESKLGRGTTFWFELPEQLEQRQLKPRASSSHRTIL